MLTRLKKIWRPEVYHGNRKKTNFFEGWFFKISNAVGDKIFAIIPGIFISRNRDDSHAFIQVINGQDHQSFYHRFPLDEFEASGGELRIGIAGNLFTSRFMELNLTSDDYRCKGKVDFEKWNPWPVRLFSPGAMGWYGFVPFMECYHGILSLDHPLHGALNINRQEIDFSGGRGYTEKDWGRSFPEAYVWTQANHFEQAGISLTASIAKIPWMGRSFRGFIIGFLWEQRLYRFTTYSGAELTGLELREDQVTFRVKDKNHVLVVRAERTEGGLLHGPYQNNMRQRVSESLKSRVQVSFFTAKDGREILLYSGTGQSAGLELNGRLEEIFDRNI